MNAVQYNGSLQDVKQLLDQGADANAKDSQGWPALQLATKRGDIEIVRLLLEKGAEVNTGNSWGVTSLDSAAYRGYADIVKLLLDKGAEVNMVFKDDTTALEGAADGGFTNVIGILLEKGANINRTNKFGDTVLMRAVEAGKTDVVKYLLACGAKVNVEDTMGSTALDTASANQNTVIMQMLQQAGATKSSATRQIGQLNESFKKVQDAEVAASNSLQNLFQPDTAPALTIPALQPAINRPVLAAFVSTNNIDESGYVTNASLLQPFAVTNSAGIVFTDAVLVKLTSNKFMYKTSSGAMGTQRLDLLPKDLQQSIGYDPYAAKLIDETEAADKAAERTQREFLRTLAASQAQAFQTSSDGSIVSSSIRENAARKWPGDYDMQKYEVDKQTKAYNWVATALSATGVPSNIFEQIKANAAGNWPEDYEMQKYEIEKQLKAYLALH